jgi:hypothetical protein
MVGLVCAALMIAVVACRPAPANATPPGSSSQSLSTVSGTPTPQQLSDVVWGRVPYCNCQVGSATARVARALQDANLTVGLEELSPHDGWLYFAATFDPHSTTRDQVGAALVTGGAQVIEGPP